MILITGGAGFIGRRLVNRSLSRERTIVVDKAQRPGAFATDQRLLYVRADAHRIPSLLQGENRRNVKIVHLAAETSVNRSILRPLSTVRNNVGLTCALLEYARTTDAKAFLFASSAAVYGERTEVCHENDPPDPRSSYAASKLAGEYYCKMYAKTYGLPVIILRYFNVYGPGQSKRLPGVITSFMRTTLSGNPPVIYGDGKHVRDFIFVDDVADATLKSLATKLPFGIVMNIGTGRAITINAVAAKILRLLDRRDLKPIHEAARPGDVQFSQADTSLARRKIGFLPRHSIDNGLNLTYRSLVGQRMNSKSCRVTFPPVNKGPSRE